MSSRMGRPEKLTKEIQSTILTFLAGGNYLETAALASGIDKNTLFHWLRRGRKAKSGKYRDFLIAVQKTQAEREGLDVAQVQKAGTKDWKATAWRLERKYRKRWGRVDSLMVGKERTAEEIRDKLATVSQETLDDLLSGKVTVEQLFEDRGGDVGSESE